MYRLAIFDIDGTLIDTERTGVESLRTTVKELLGKDISYQDSYRSFGIPSRQVASLYDFPDTDLFSRRWEENFIAISHLITPFPGVTDALKEIKRAGFMTGVVTSRNKMEFEFDEHLKAMLPFLDHIVCAEDAPRPKPFPDPVLKCISMAAEASGKDIALSDVIYFGDTDHDFRCAESAGCDFALADWKGRGWQGLGARYKFSSALGMSDILLGGSHFETKDDELQ